MRVNLKIKEVKEKWVLIVDVLVRKKKKELPSESTCRFVPRTLNDMSLV